MPPIPRFLALTGAMLSFWAAGTTISSMTDIASKKGRELPLAVSPRLTLPSIGIIGLAIKANRRCCGQRAIEVSG